MTDTYQAEEVVETTIPPPEVDQEGTPANRRMSVRESLQDTFEKARVDEQREERKRSGRFSPTGAKRAVPAAEDNVRDDAGVPGEDEQTQSTPSTQPPAAWAKDAKESWAYIPETARAAILKREEDVQKGVNDLKARYAGIDEALRPHMKEIEAYGKSPAQAVDQLFKWFQAITINPDQAFPALLRSYNYPVERLMQVYGIQPQGQQQQPQQQQDQQPQQEEIPPYINDLKKELDLIKNGFGQQIYGMQNAWAEHNMARTHETLNVWAKDKPYFEEVRQLMGHLLTPDRATGVAAVPLKDGMVDLDAAYDMAVRAHPEVYSRVQADNQARAEAERKAKADAEAKAQQEKVEKAKRASSSIKGSAPGPDISKKPNNKGKSVRESLMASIEELNA